MSKLKSGIKNGTKVILNLSSKLSGNSNNKIIFSHKLLLSDTQVLEIRKAFANGSSANIKLSKTQRSNMVQAGVFLPGALGLLNLFPPFNIINSIVNPYEKEVNNTNPKEINSNLLVEAAINIIGKKNLKELSSI